MVHYPKSLYNFAPRGNFGAILARSLASSGEFCTQDEQNEVCKWKVFTNVYSIHLSVGDKMSNVMFPRGPKLKTLTVPLGLITVLAQLAAVL
jgi:hypothetical protein